MGGCLLCCVWCAQGTVLGPYLFLFHLLELSSNLSAGTPVSSFDDDTRLQHGIESEQDCESLQQDPVTMYTWAEDVGMEFNAGKFKLLRFWAT